MVHTVWAILPPIVTIILALTTKEVYMSLFTGIFFGAFMYSQYSILGSIATTFQIMNDKIGGNVYILMFMIILGIFVAAVNKSGASEAYGEWATKAIKGRRMAMFVTMLLGIIIFIDDYFNCLTVGTVMRPVTDKFHISRAKLAYLIDATAAPICILAPISSWAAAVSSSLPQGSGIDGFSLFLQTIPVNLYALFTLVFMVFLNWTGKDFSKMKQLEEKNINELVINKSVDDSATIPVGNGKIIDLLLPLIALIIACTFGIMYTGGILEGATIQESFANSEASRGLVIGSFMGLVFTFIFYIPRKILTFSEFCQCYVDGFKAMVPGMLILSLAWTLSGICSKDYLDLGGYVATLVSSSTTIATLLPVFFFLVAVGLSFATGTSWGTFGILIPIIIAITGESNMALLTITVAAVLSGAVAGDHLSPISDTTIMSSTGAQCNHLDHVATQLPYGLIIITCSVIGYVVAGITSVGLMGTLAGFISLLIVMVIIYQYKLS